MTASAIRPRDAARRSTQLAAIGQSVGVVASAGLAMAMAAPAAFAAPQASEGAPGTRTIAPQPTSQGGQTVLVPADAEWQLGTTSVRGEKPAPPPVVRETSTASRSAARTAEATTTAVAAPRSATAAAVLEIARRYVGVPYVYGGTTPAGFDCSGYTQYVYAQIGVNLPRTSSAQRYAGAVVPASQAQPGDLVWWPGHIGIYTGNGQHIAARQPGTALYEGPVYGTNPVYIRVL